MITKRFHAIISIGSMAATLLACSGRTSVALEIVKSSGTFSNGEAFEIYGTGFGTKTHAAPIRFDDFEEGTVEHDVTADFPWWSKSTNTPSIPIVNTKPRGVSSKAIYQYLKAAKDSTEAGNTVSILYRNNVGFAETGKIFVSWWTYWDWGTFNTQNGGMNLTYSQIKELDLPVSVGSTGQPTFPLLEYIHWIYSLDSTPYSKIYQQEYYYGTQSGNQNLNIRDNLRATTSLTTLPGWYHTEMQIDMGSPGTANGSRKIWNSDYNFLTPYLANSTTNDMVLGNATNTNLINAIKFGWYRGYTNQGESYIWHDDIYIDNSWARVELGDQDTYDKCTHREIQIPAIWDGENGHIQIKINTGSFNANDQVYLYVVAEDGIPNAKGHPLTVGKKYTSLDKVIGQSGKVVQ